MIFMQKSSIERPFLWLIHLSSTNTISFLKSTGDTPAFRLKNFPNEDWSEKLRVVAISCIESLECVSKLRASLNSISKMKSLTLCPVTSFTICVR